ncbi:glyoxalase [Bacillus velezensis]|uniref:glyoxalase n=1 Tax=Bacillus velezensis TaxID=492670 RepID=UPI003A7FDE50
MIYGEALAFGRKRGFYVTRLKRIEVVASLKAETSLVLHDKQAITNMQPELDLHTPSMMCFTANLEHHGGDIVNMPSGRVFIFASWRNKQKLIQNRRFLSRHCYCSFDRERNAIRRFCYGK